MQRWPKYGNTDVDTRTVHDLLNTINTLSTRVKTLERYERALREIHKVIVILKPTANIQSFDADALPALVTKSLSDFVGRDINTLTHNINYKYDYNMPYPFPGPSPFIPPPQPPQQPPTTFPPYPQYPYNQYPGSQFQTSSQQPPQPPPTHFPSPEQASGSGILKKINFTNDENRELETLYNRITEQNEFSLPVYELYMNFVIKIMRIYFTSMQIVQITEYVKTNISLLIEYDFKEFLECIRRETTLLFIKDQLLCRKVSAFVKFFLQIYEFYYKKNFTYTEETNIKLICDTLYTNIVDYFQSANEVKNELKDELKNERRSLEDLRERLRSSEQNLIHHKERIDKLNTDNRQLIADKENLEMTAIADKEHLHRRIEKMDVSTEEEDNQKILELNDKLKKLLDEHKDLKSLFDSSIADNKSLHDQTQYSNEKINALQQEIESSRKQIQTLNEELKTEQNVQIPITKFVQYINHLYGKIQGKPSEDLDEKINFVFKWLKQIISTRDLVNLQSIKEQNEEYKNIKFQYDDLRSLIFNRFLVKSEKDNGSKTVVPNDLSDVDLVARVSLLFDDLSNKATTKTKDCLLKIEKLEGRLNEVGTAVQKMSQFSVDPTKKLNDQTIQELQKTNASLESDLKVAKTMKEETLKNIAEESVNQELSKLNEQIANITDLFSKYDSFNKDIFEWKTRILQMYETLARTYSQK
jgi:Viral Desmoplakin N-terminus